MEERERRERGSLRRKQLRNWKLCLIVPSAITTNALKLRCKLFVNSEMFGSNIWRVYRERDRQIGYLSCRVCTAVYQAKIHCNILIMLIIYAFSSISSS